MYVSIRKSTLKDLDSLINIEKSCFPEFQQSSGRSLRTSLISSSQEVWIAEIRGKKQPVVAGVIIIHIHRKSLRIWSIGVLAEYRGLGVGMKLLNHVFNIALARHFVKISLEARVNDSRLVEWYTRAGFTIEERLQDYYKAGCDAYRMVAALGNEKEKHSTENIIVVDNRNSWKLEVPGVRIVTAKNYISDPEFQTARNLRVFNLCNSYRYQSLGYYVSLLASAREHRSFPNVTTIGDFKNKTIVQAIASDIDDLMQETLRNETENKVVLKIYFERTVNPARRLLGQRLYKLFESPLLQVHCIRNGRWIIQKVVPLGLKNMDPTDLDKIQEFAKIYFSKKRFSRPKLKQYKYDLAILINPDEQNPPSCPAALRHFKEAAQKVGFYTEFITRDDISQIGEFDALFIRETTDITNHTYQFSRLAYAEGLVVIDDPWSILRCSNKIYIDERMRQNRINTPKTWVLNKGLYKPSQFDSAVFPIVLKQPDSAFSRGVIKVDDQSQLTLAVKELFKKSDLLVAQEFIPSEFDWRIGILDQRPLFACKYYMAKGHWQIYNWGGELSDQMGEAETIAIENVPEQVLKVATKAAVLMGDGLYGIDLKVINNKVYIIEINDNPNIDAGIEDKILKEELYIRIMKSIYERIEMSRNMARFVSAEPGNYTNGRLNGTNRLPELVTG
jgi:glutathione synthase/RimK-type ligase-like ATP-grasp enzyme/ribosomal protein S18 acetylase RimI-like enzyme